MQAAQPDADDAGLISVLAAGDRFLSISHALGCTLSSARLELAFSRVQRGSVTGACMAYVPRGRLQARLRVRVRGAALELVDAAAARGAEPAGAPAGPLRRRRAPGAAQGEGGALSGKAFPGDDCDSEAGDSRDPLAWFGANASPSVARGRSSFAAALTLAVGLAGAKADLRAAAEGLVRAGPS